MRTKPFGLQIEFKVSLQTPKGAVWLQALDTVNSIDFPAMFAAIEASGYRGHYSERLARLAEKTLRRLDS